MPPDADRAEPDARRRDREIAIPVGAAVLRGVLDAPRGARGLVVFAHGSGSGRKSPRNVWVAAKLGKSGFATLLFDLLTADEEAVDLVTAKWRFNVALLGERLVAVTDWASREPATAALPVGYFGASTGAAAALLAAAQRPEVAAVVSRGGRPDLAGAALADVRAPTLLIVGGDDPEVIALNRAALARLRCDSRLEIVPGATHLFEEPGKLERVANLAAEWFERCLVPAAERWETYPHGADVGIRGYGRSPAQAFESIGFALTSTVCDPTRVHAAEAVEIRCEAPDLESLLYAWVNAIVYEMATRHMLFARYSVRIADGALSAVAHGEALDVARHEPAVEIKGATYTDLRVRQERDGAWVAQCVIDV